jgi:hypothetical protein
MTDDETRDALFSALESNRGDRVSLSALADWFEEQGEPDARECLRWVVAAGRRPGFNEHQQTYGKCFWERESPHPILNDPPAQLPEPLWLALLENDEPHAVASFKSYKTARAAWLALLAGWKRISFVPPPT